MAGGGQDGPGLPTSGLITVAVLLASAIVVHQLPYIVSRPPVGDTAWRPYVARQDVDARLWQDPFGAVIQHLEQVQPRSRGSEVDWTEVDRHGADAMAADLRRRDLTKTVLMPVMLLGGRYGEDIEGRRRTRYAVIAGLNRLGFTPEDAERIGFFRSKAPSAIGYFGSLQSKQSTGGLELPAIVPWEFFIKKPKEPKKPELTSETGANRVLVLWVDASAFGDPPPRGPLAKLQRLLDDVGLCRPGPQAGARVVMIGPSSSDDLQPLREDQAKGKWECLTGMTIYSPWATAEELMAPKETSGIGFVRMIGTDKSLMPELSAELARRDVRPPFREHAVAVVYEFDTRYGRDLVGLAREGLCSKDDPNGDCIYALGYLRGIDGKIPKRSEPKDGAGEAKGPATQPAAPSEEDLERAEGDTQFDYLRRLAMRMRGEHDRLVRANKPGISAIGVFGSDLYDKLLVLQAVRQEFPTAVFFTTDLDARYMHPREFQWTRNVIVASSFGLQLREDVQKDLPPFRNNYQTATFLATMVGVVNGSPAGGAKVSPERIQGWLEKPHIYEIGRTESVDLSAMPTKPQTGSATCGSLADCPNIHPEPVFFDAPYRKTARGWELAVLFGLILLPLVSSNVRQGIAGTAEWSKTHRMYAAVSFLLIAAFVLLIRYVVLGVAAEGRNGEPFRFFEGVSIWPTEILRVASICVAVVGIVMTEIRRGRTEQALHTRYFKDLSGPLEVPSITKFGPSTWRRMFAGKPGRSFFSKRPYIPVEALWAEHHYQNAPLARRTRIAIGSLLYFAIGAAIISIRTPVTPVRGDFARLVDQCTIYLNVWVLIVLIFCVGDTIKLCDKFAYCLGAPNPNRWSRSTRVAFGTESADEEAAADSWIDIRFLAEWTGRIGGIIYYPFVVLFLMIIARSSIFDNWDMPPSLVAVLLLSIAFASATVFILRGAAERLRRVSIERLTKELVVQEGLAPEGPAVKQLRTILDEVRGMKQGAFAPITSQPLVRAALLPLSGAGGIALLEYFFLRR